MRIAPRRLGRHTAPVPLQLLPSPHNSLPHPNPHRSRRPVPSAPASILVTTHRFLTVPSRRRAPPERRLGRRLSVSPGPPFPPLPSGGPGLPRLAGHAAPQSPGRTGGRADGRTGAGVYPAENRRVSGAGGGSGSAGSSPWGRRGLGCGLVRGTSWLGGPGRCPVGLPAMPCQPAAARPAVCGGAVRGPAARAACARPREAS